MSWRDNLRAASFRGVAFHYAETGGEHGRRLARHEYPGRDLPFLEDLGRKAREHSLSAYVLGADHMDQARRLIEACEKPGPGTLIHPYLGELRVACTGCRQRYTTRDGGMAHFELSFVEAGDNRYPTIRTDTAAAVDAAADEALSAVKTDFKKVFKVDGLPGFVAEEAANITGLAADDIEASVRAVMAAGDDLAAFARDAAALKADASTLVHDPAALADAVTGLIGHPAGGDVFAAPPSSFGDDLAPVPATTPSRRAQGDNQAALSGLVRRGRLIERIRAASVRAFKTRLDAVNAREGLADLVDGETRSATAPVYNALTALQASLTRHVAAIAPALPRVVVHSPTTTRPALAVANELYGDKPETLAGRAREIAGRNRLRHPAMAPGGAELEALSDD